MEIISPITLTSFFSNHLNSYLDMLKIQVGMNSFTYNSEGLNAVGQLTAEQFMPLGFSTEFIQSYRPEFGKHLILTKQGTGSKTIGLVSHLDTVFSSEDETKNEFYWRQEGDKIYGPGTNDIKGGTIMIYMLLDAIKQLAPDVYAETTWVVLLDAAEEADGVDFGKICCERLAKAEACLIFESGAVVDDDYWIVTQRKGMGIFNVSVEGRASHSGTAHERGANAVVQMAEVIQKVAAMTNHDKELTFNVGYVKGGTVTNRVPHEAEMRLELRTFEPALHKAAIEQTLALEDMETVSALSDGYACSVHVALERKMDPWPKNEGSEKLYQVWAETADNLNIGIKRQARGGLSDGNMIWHSVPTIDGLGPRGKNAHCSERSDDGSKEQEYVLESSFVPKAVLNTLSIIKLLGH